MPKLVNKIMNFLVLFGILATLIAALCIDSNTTYRPPESGQPFSDGWSLLDESGNSVPVDLPLSFEGDTLCITKILPQIDDDAVLLVKCNYKTMKAELNGRSIYESGLATLGNISTDTGHYVAIIPLSSEYSGQEIRLTVEERDTGYNSQLKYINLTTSAAYGFGLLMDKYAYLAVAVVLYIAGILSIAVWIPVRRRLNDDSFSMANSLLWVGVFAFSLGTWILTEPHFTGIATGAFATSGMLNYLSLMVFPVAVTGLLRQLIRKRFLLIEILLILLEAVFCAEVVLFLLFGVDLSDMLRVFHFSVVVSVVVFFVVLICNSSETQFSTPTKIGILLSLLLCFVAVVVYAMSGDYMLVAIIAVVVFIISILSHNMLALIRALNEVKINLSYKDFAMKDAMTELGNRMAFGALCEQYAAGVPEDLVLVYMDTDNLKASNDRFGHDAGDELIIGTADCIKETFGSDGKCFRMGGDEFLAVISVDKEELKQRLDRLDQLAKNWKGNYGVSLTVSCGVALARENPELPFEELVKAADSSMYQHKHRVIDGN